MDKTEVGITYSHSGFMKPFQWVVLDLVFTIVFKGSHTFGYEQFLKVTLNVLDLFEKVGNKKLIKEGMNFIFNKSYNRFIITWSMDSPMSQFLEGYNQIEIIMISICHWKVLFLFTSLIDGKVDKPFGLSITSIDEYTVDMVDVICEKIRRN
jgi:hypothetical protein